MKIRTEVDMEINCKKFSTAINRFFAKHPELDYWKETFEYMYENNEDFFADTKLANGERNNDWGYALHLDVYEDHFYMAVIERA